MDPNETAYYEPSHLELYYAKEPVSVYRAERLNKIAYGLPLIYLKYLYICFYKYSVAHNFRFCFKYKAKVNEMVLVWQQSPWKKNQNKKRNGWLCVM